MSFHPFPKLPPEIRQQIWSLSLPGPRFISYRSPNPPNRRNHDPIALEVNHESRGFALRFYDELVCPKSDGRPGSVPYRYIDYAIDIVCFDSEFSFSRWQASNEDLFSQAELARMTVIELEIDDKEGGWEGLEKNVINWIAYRIDHFPALRELRIVPMENYTHAELAMQDYQHIDSATLVSLFLEVDLRLQAIQKRKAKEGVVWWKPEVSLIRKNAWVEDNWYPLPLDGMAGRRMTWDSFRKWTRYPELVSSAAEIQKLLDMPNTPRPYDS